LTGRATTSTPKTCREKEETARYFGVYVIPQEVLSIWPPIGSEPDGTQTRAAEALTDQSERSLAQIERPMEESGARTAEGEPDGQIRKTFEYESPAKTMSDGRDLEDVPDEVDDLLDEQEKWRDLEKWRADMEQWRAERDPVVQGSKGGKETQKRRREDKSSEDWRPYAERLRIRAVKALAAVGNRNPSQKEIAEWIGSHWEFPWNRKDRDRPSRSTLMAFLSQPSPKK
jgi:hypothetical protein